MDKECASRIVPAGVAGSSKSDKLSSSFAAPSTELYDPTSSETRALSDLGQNLLKVIPLPNPATPLQPAKEANTTSALGLVSPCKPVKSTVKKQHGEKVVSLVKGLEIARIDAKVWGPEIMRSLGTSASVTALPTASKGGGASVTALPPHEVLVQGDQTVYLMNKLVEQNAMPRSAIDVEGMGGKKSAKRKQWERR